MPTLLEAAWKGACPSNTYLWSCSLCDTIFNLGPLRGSSPSRKEIDRVDLQFETHCKQMHPGLLPVTGLTARPATH
jgi:hypothetical protein